jgi:hypothetical protein
VPGSAEVKSALVVGLIALSAAAGPSPTGRASEPTIRVVDRASLDQLIQPGSLPRFGSVKGIWRIDVDLPRNLAVRHFSIEGYDPVVLHLADGRCFKVQMDSGGEHLTSARIDRTECAPDERRVDPWPPARPRAGMRHLGRARDLDLWFDRRTGSTFFVQAVHQDRPPVMSTSMRIAAAGALGSVDVPMTELTLVGYVGRQLTIATVMLYLPEVSP